MNIEKEQVQHEETHGQTEKRILVRRFPPTYPPITLKQFAVQRVKGTVTWITWVDALGLEQATKRACCGMYQDWLGHYFPRGLEFKLGRIECERLRDAWLDIGHPFESVVALFAIGSREDRWIMPDEKALTRLNVKNNTGATKKFRRYEVTITPKTTSYAGSWCGDAYTVEIDAQTNSEAITKARQQRNEVEGRYGVRATYRARLAEGQVTNGETK